MKLLRPNKDLLDNLSLARLIEQIDNWLGTLAGNQLVARVARDANQVYTVKVYDGMGNPVDNAVVIVYMQEPNGTLSTTGYINCPSGSPSGWAILLNMDTPGCRYMFRIPQAGGKYIIKGNTSATLHAAVLGKMED